MKKNNIKKNISYLASLVCFVSCAGLLKTKVLSTSKERLPSSLKESLNAMDEKKPTVCTMTFNSSDEKHVFADHLDDEFNFVELIDSENKDWFEESCRSGVKCDVLIVSGHFGGYFFGESGAKESLSKFENLSCKKSCDGIFKNPKEVFLFGCNTTAGKEKDLRSEEDYAELLREHSKVYTSDEIAEMHAAFRYSPLGAETSERMKSVFTNANIYGFKSVSPLGKYMKKRLVKYLKKIDSKNYNSFLKETLETGKNPFWENAMEGLSHDMIQGSKDIQNPSCILNSEKSVIEKISWVKEIFKNEENILKYAPNVYIYIKSLERKFGRNLDAWPREELSYLEELKQSKISKKSLIEFLKEPQAGILYAQLDTLNFAKRIGWFSKEEAKKIQINLTGKFFHKNVSKNKMEYICSLNTSLDLEVSDLPKENLTRETIEALGCVNPQDVGVQLKIVEALNGPDDRLLHKSLSAKEALMQMDINDERVANKLFKNLSKGLHLEHSSYAGDFDKDSLFRVKQRTLLVIGNTGTDDIKIHKEIVKYFAHEDRFVVRAAHKAILNLKPKEEEVHLDLVVLAENLKNTSFTRQFALLALWSLQSPSTDVQKRVSALLDDKDINVKKLAANSLGEMKTRLEDVHFKLAELVGNKKEDSSVRSNAFKALVKIKPKNKKVLKVMKSYSVFFRIKNLLNR